MQRGFSLVEVVVSATLLAVGVSALAHLVAAGLNAGRVATTRAVTANLAARKMEELRLLDWEALPAAAAVEYFDADGVERCKAAAASCSEAVFTRTARIVPADFNASILIITVDVVAVDGRHGHTTLTTARGRRTP